MHPIRLASIPLALGLLFAAAPLAAQAPAGSTGLCKDNSYTSAKAKSGACSGHGGVKTWMGTPAAPLVVAKPAGATGSCSDGSFTKATTKAGACSSHGGVKDWYAPVVVTAPPARTAPPTRPIPPPPPPAATPTMNPTSRVVPIPGAPALATALCNDGTYSQSKHRSGTCSYHKGVKQWLKDVPK